jgi:hypothetical protein
MSIDLPPPIWTPEKPAIIRALPAPFRVRIGEQHGASEIEYREWAFPRDIREASLAEALVYMPKDVDFDFPEWALGRLLPKMGMFVPGLLWNPVSLVKTVVFLTTTNAADQSWSVLSDWNSADNNVEVIAPGGSGGGRRGGTSSSTSSNASGGGGGAYSGQTNITLTPSGSATYRLPAGGAAHNVASLGASASGSVGADAWFNSTSLAGSSVGAKGGGAGNAGISASGAAGGASASGIGATKTSGGGSATSSTTIGATGGGGAGGPTSNGVASTTSTGGNGGSPSGGTGSAASNAGGDGTHWQASPARGSGGGSGGDTSQTGGSSATSGAGGNFGGGSGGCATRQTSGSPGSAIIGAGGPALIVITNNFTL